MTEPIVSAPGERSRARIELLRTWGSIFGIGWLVGAGLAIAGQVDGELFLTDGWSYRPRDHWWLHGVFVGLGFVLVFVGLFIGFWILGRLFATKYPFAIVGAFIVTMGSVLVVLGIRSEARSDQIGYAAVGAFPLLLGVLMIWANLAPSKRSR